MSRLEEALFGGPARFTVHPHGSAPQPAVSRTPAGSGAPAQAPIPGPARPRLAPEQPQRREPIRLVRPDPEPGLPDRASATTNEAAPAEPAGASAVSNAARPVSPLAPPPAAAEPAGESPRTDRLVPQATADWRPMAAGHLPLAVEQYRKLAGTLLHAKAANGARVVMIASAVQGEGKTATAANLALTLCRSYRQRVLLVDADLRLPSLHTIFKVPNTSGLTEYLMQGDAHVLRPVEVYPSLTLVTAGRPTSDPVGGLTSPAMARLIEDARGAYDWIVVDTPPVALLPDARLLSAMVDGVLLVIGAGSTPYEFLTKAVEALGRERILGAVLNRATRGTELKGYSHYSGY